jgi:hypothetical protein
MENTKGKAETFFSKAGKKIDDLLNEIRHSNISEKIELNKRLEELKRNKEKLQQDFEKFSQENQQNFKDIANSFEESFEDIKAAFKRKNKD